MIKTVVSVGLPVLETMHIKKNRIMPLQSKEAEKRICIITGIHGDELEGQYICYQLIKKINENIDDLNGIVDVYPCVNPLGMESITRRIPTFDLDMNRSFPGDMEGDMSEFVAAKLVEDIEGADFCVDLHASNIFLREVPQVRINKEDEEKLLPYCKLLNTDFIWVHSSPTVQPASIYHSLNHNGVPTISIEMGVGMRITKSFGDQILEGIFCLMKELGIWKGEVITPKEPIVSTDRDKVTLIHAEASGVFLPRVEHLMGIRAGEVVGEIVDALTGTVASTIIAPCDGIVFTLREYPVVYNGSLIARILGGA
ncbi:MAG: M14 family metallopeptidase [Clostridiales bacterium]|nr:M14 family metallopeptidase [Clostridiales bacterium]